MINILYISIGNELLMGKTVNTNEAFIGRELFAAGFHLDRSITIGDDEATIRHTVSDALKGNDVIILTGGLGPTHDDITKETIASIFSKKLQFDETVWNTIETRYREAGKVPPEIVRTQAEVPEDFIAINNEDGTAPGLYHNIGTQLLFVLPGVPREMRPMIKNHGIPILKEHFSTEPLYQKTIRTFGLYESEIFEKLHDIKETDVTKIAFLPKAGMVDIRLFGTDKKEIKKFRERIEAKIDPVHIYGYDDESLVEVFHNAMMKNGKTLSAAESCTGGLIQSMITDNAGSSDYFLGGVVSYSNEAKMNLLGVNASTLDKWGAVSEQTVKEMVLGAKKLFRSDYAIAVSGIAGPGGGTEDKPVGLVYIGTFGNEGLTITKNNFRGSRTQIKIQTVNTALNQLISHPALHTES